MSTPLRATDQTFREVAELLFGGGADELVAKMQSGVSKMNPAQSDVAAHQERKKRMLGAGLSAIGASAGAGGLALAGKELHHGMKTAQGATRLKRLGTAVKSKKIATALLPLEVAGLGGELMATKILHGDTKKKPGALVQKDIGELLNNASEMRPSAANLTRAAVSNPKVRKKGLEYTKKGAGVLRKLPDKVTTSNQVEKCDVVWEGDIAKADSDKQQIFGWASVVEVDGAPVIDRQGDVISAEEMEKAGYEFVLKSRKGGDMHLRDNWAPIQKSEMIESFVVTPEKRSAMGLPDSVPTGWWVGFQVRDDELWDKIKKGERTGFSIHGHGRRQPAGGI